MESLLLDLPGKLLDRKMINIMACQGVGQKFLLKCLFVCGGYRKKDYQLVKFLYIAELWIL